ncbi:hypothetical protein [Pseudoalteromonas sp. S16_S37]|uniref:hypothetical protein n=1 Tax=Pseudoalteromonas sp. S16_S37 TaxID=2720228 RepID=UPI001680C739|nr:hypothetical protein [Pseudoalteromonas sp. S16_S37]MBD1583577.1 hypothetical protein [Pseudoalteromonas sp. S16_S37]
MKKLILSTLFASSLCSSAAMAADIRATTYSSASVALAAQQANIHLDTFTQAIIKYEAWLASIDNQAHRSTDDAQEIKPFNQLEAMRALTNGAQYTPQLQADLLTQYNDNQAKLATYLGLSVDDLMPFVKSHADLYMKAQASN